MNELDQAKKAKDNAYWERNQLVAALSKIYHSHLARHSDNDKEWEDDWRNIVVIYIPSPRGRDNIQVTWHIHDFDMPMFDHLESNPGFLWDGHDTTEKYRRLRSIPTKNGNIVDV